MKPWEKYQKSDQQGPWSKYQGVAKQEDSVAEPQTPDDGFSFGEMVSNIPSSAGKLASGIYQSVRHPVQTAEAVGQSIAGMAQNSDDQGLNAGPLTLLGRALEYLGVDYRTNGEALQKALEDRYGSIDATLQTIEQDPVGAMADLSMVVAPFSPKAGAAINPINASLNTAKYGVSKAIPKGAPKRMYERVSKFGTTIPEKQRSAMIDTALKHEIMPTNKGAVKLEGIITSLNNKIDSLIASAAESGKTVPANAVYSNLNSLRKNKGGMSLDAPGDLQAINKIVAEFQKHLKAKGKAKLTPADLQELKVNTYKSINWDAKRMTGTPIKEDTYKAIARGAKESLESVAPDVKGVNAELGSLYELQPHLQRAANRIENKNIISLSDAPQVGVGGVVGGPAGATLGAIVSFLGKDKVQAIGAVKLQRAVNNANFQQFLKNNPNISKAQMAAAIAGRDFTESD